jgi:hypothetical protein
MDCQADRKQSLLHIHHLALEPGLLNTEAFARALGKALGPFLQFNNCRILRLHKTSPASVKPLLQAEIQSQQQDGMKTKISD